MRAPSDALERARRSTRTNGQASPSRVVDRSASLSLWDAVSIIIGIVVGTAIFRSPTVVFQNVAGP